MDEFHKLEQRQWEGFTRSLEFIQHWWKWYWGLVRQVRVRDALQLGDANLTLCQCILSCDFTHFQWFSTLLNFVLRFYSFFQSFSVLLLLVLGFYIVSLDFHDFTHFQANSHTFSIISAISHISQWLSVFSKFPWQFYTFSNYFVFFLQFLLYCPEFVEHQHLNLFHFDLTLEN